MRPCTAESRPGSGVSVQAPGAVGVLDPAGPERERRVETRARHDARARQPEIREELLEVDPLPAQRDLHGQRRPVEAIEPDERPPASRPRSSRARPRRGAPSGRGEASPRRTSGRPRAATRAGRRRRGPGVRRARRTGASRSGGPARREEARGRRTRPRVSPVVSIFATSARTGFFRSSTPPEASTEIFGPLRRRFVRWARPGASVTVGADRELERSRCSRAGSSPAGTRGRDA